MDWWDGHELYFEIDGMVTTEINSQVRESHDKMRCRSKFNKASQLVNNDRSLRKDGAGPLNGHQLMCPYFVVSLLLCTVKQVNTRPL